MPQTKSTKKPAATTAKKSGGITAGERAAVKELRPGEERRKA